MPISRRLVASSAIGLLAVGFLTLLGIVATTMWLGERAQTHFNEVVRARDMRTSATELRNALQSAEASQRGYILTDNEIYLAPYGAAKANMQSRLEALRQQLGPFPDMKPMLDRLVAVVAQKLVEMDQTIAMKRDRQDAEAMAIMRTNRGKALMDEANVFLSGVVRAADARLTASVAEQNANAAMLRWVSILGAVGIVLVVGIVGFTVLRYTREVAQARDEVRALNTGLEERVKSRTIDLERARDRAQVLLAEVNHRVANSLSLVASMVQLQGNAVRDAGAKSALAETEARIFAISFLHQRLYSSGDVHLVALDEYLSGLLDHLQAAMRKEGHGSALRYDLEPLQLKTDESINLGVVVTEWVTNAFKYAYPERGGEVRVRLARVSGGHAELVVEDDGVGRSEDTPTKGTGLGTRIVTAMAATMDAKIEYLRRPRGTIARLSFPLQQAA